MSHAYVHIVEVGVPVTVGGLTVRPGDIIHGGRHGVISIPAEIAGALPDAIREIEADERQTISYCQSANFSGEGLMELWRRRGEGVRH